MNNEEREKLNKTTINKIESEPKIHSKYILYTLTFFL